MTVVDDWLLDDSLAPAVAGDPLEPLYAGAARGVLVLPFCARCAIPLDLEQHVCDRCGSGRIDWAETVPTGVVHSSTTMHRLEPGLVATTGPYPIVDIELTGGHRLIMTTVDWQADSPQIGDVVDIGFRNLAGVAIPAAQPRNTTDTEAPDDNR
ncbi:MULTISPECIES: Zn-ribbon domain-containing OB-fold protein [Gordonia]|uniref:OB-fold domain-containing protein n=1 Tax=Gordonia hongkongensis TaxID=1701090 RepID=A0ABT6BWB2_9ACTN|nr:MULTISPECIES: OB-fold domain-containing protein [Gordonia]MCT1351991.1 OB-fold domain-containing protein [Gordonia sp. p3-SID1431]MDF6102359.1 OB-fold domain-containing protein [Gordonia hongkongensis]OCH79200.1 3-ketoacyl-CoA thiolase [Gordonia sp. UCD-TK1]UPG67762.1 OB-fold domain-containing protein [Gordonia hongkongensis]WGJ85075.1 OB-fold domain-containing protein [Gordonia sp. SMJS1]